MKNRIYQIDLLKIIAFFFVVIVHHNVYVIGESLNYPYLYITKSCVPLFIMATGFLLFRKEKSLKELWTKAFKELLIPSSVIWILGVLLVLIINPFMLETFNEFLKKYLLEWRLHDMTGYSFHLWYINLLLGIYIAYPLLSLICKDDEKTTNVRRYVMAFTFLGSFCLPTIEILFGINFFPRYGIEIFDMYYILYVLLGYELYLLYKNQKLENVANKYGVLLLIIGIVSCSLLSKGNYDLIKHPKFSVEPYNLYNTVPLLLFSFGLFLTIMRIKIKNIKCQQFICKLGERSFIFYLIHCFIVTNINTNTNWIQILQNYFSPLSTLLLISIFSFMVTILFGWSIDWLIKGVKRDIKQNQKTA